MKNSKLVAEAKSDPNRIYQRPNDVLRDRRLDDAARLEILRAWYENQGKNKGLGRKELHDLEEALGEIEQKLSDQRASV